MSRTIVVGLDGSTESLAAAEWAAREALLTDARLRVVHAWLWHPYVYAPLAGVTVLPPSEDTQLEWAERLPREAADRLAAEHSGLSVSAERLAEQPATGLLAAAEGADLLVLGSRGLSGVHGFLVGSVALSVVARTRTPVVLVRAEARPAAANQRRDVVLGLDLEHADATVIGFAFEAAAQRAADLRVVHGWGLPPYYGLTGASDPSVNAELLMEAQHRSTEVLRPWREKFPDVDVSAQAVIGGAGPHLVDASRDATLVVVGRRNRSAAVGAHIGPVTQAVLHHSAAPVAVVPHD
ncbi:MULTISPECIES: universal stress protein [unclassified Streptomyces]|uniref:universal stress protein n=1 Tax=unclassified Streptomyces TaxID=2593676 RepID=UPI0013BD4FE5|nr:MULTISPECIES: universal stress protein [unclassified Streptomyces]MCX4913153.1 universal stress protein [Streptomyces sp. NBC_00687]NEB33778.1 universal stress protein [Streptomyces sp. SID14446]WSK64744.1 universal stress protein [Streptomyces sp. NBC_01281]